jgi:PPOX class probable F420-dependent enzyme
MTPVLSEAMRAVLSQPLIARLGVIDADGYPHTVPLWFLLDGDDILITSFRDTRKVDHLRRNPRASLVVGGDALQWEGYMIKGEVTIEDDPGHAFMRRITHVYEPHDEAEAHLAEWTQQPAVMLRLKPRKASRVY